jgi:biopolymer transport protein ExbD
MDFDRPGAGGRATVNVTPLIDIVLVMLIIFMVLTPSVVKNLVVTIPKPPPTDARDDGMPPITVAYSEGRKIAVNREPVAFEALAAKVANKLRFDKHKLVFFQVDEACDYGEVVKLMDTVRGAGAKTLAVLTSASASASAGDGTRTRKPLAR